VQNNIKFNTQPNTRLLEYYFFQRLAGLDKDTKNKLYINLNEDYIDKWWSIHKLAKNIIESKNITLQAFVQ